MPRRPSGDTSDRILDVAERLIQIHGFNGFSYADIAAELRVKNASIHHHFPSKADLGVKLVNRYRENFGEALHAIVAASSDARRQLRRYARLYRDVLRDRNRMCLCGMLASDLETLPRPVRRGVKEFFDAHEVWLADVLDHGRKSGRLRFAGTPALHARMVLSTLEGAMLVARSYGEPARFDAVAERLFTDLEG